MNAARLALAACALLAACADVPQASAPQLAGRIWDVPAGRFVAPEDMLARSAAARRVILGEVHDNPEHRRLQRRALEALAALGPRRALAMEQFDGEHQAALDAARAQGAGADALAEAGRFDRKGWGWEMYQPLVEFAVTRGWPLAAANLSRGEARAIVTDPARAGLPPPDARLREALERDLVEGHCGSRPPAARLAGLVEAQRARDARMARVIAQAPSVLIAGNGHARKDTGVPLYLPDADVVSIALIEVDPHKHSPADYLDGFATPASFDFLWFTPRFDRPDPCGQMRVRR